MYCNRSGNYYEHENHELKKYIDGKGFNLEYILLTHCHIDHILGLKYLNDYYDTKSIFPQRRWKCTRKVKKCSSLWSKQL